MRFLSEGRVTSVALAALIASGSGSNESSLEERLSPSASDRLGEIKARTLILEGESDIPDVQAHCQAIKAGIPGSERIVVKGAGHLIQLEKPEEIVQRLADFAKQCARE